MALGFKPPIQSDDFHQKGHETTYQADSGPGGEPAQQPGAAPQKGK
ncbi:hypothetical protein [Streptomyces sp. NPDC003717]